MYIKRGLLLLLFGLSVSASAHPPAELLTNENERQKSGTVPTPLVEPLLFFEATNKKSLILLHGLYEKPASMLPLAQLHWRNGFNTYVPILPGHGPGLAGIENTESQDYAYFMQQQTRLFAGSDQEVSLAGFSIGGVVLADFLVSRREQWPPEIKHLIFISATFADSPAIADRETFFSRGAQRSLLRHHGDSASESAERSVEISTRSLAVMDAMRHKVDSLPQIELPPGLRVSVYVNPNDNVSDTAAELGFYEKLVGPKELIMLEAGNKHIAVPASLSLLEKFRTCKSGLNAFGH